MARPVLQITDEKRNLVRKLSGYSMKQDQIAELVEISPKTLRRHFRKELTRGPLETKARLASKLFEVALAGNGNTAVLIFLAKTLLGMRENAPEEQGRAAVPNFVVNVQEKVVHEKIAA